MGLSILVTGASGFIGSHIVEEALRRDEEVWAAIRPTSSKQYLTNKKINFIYLDFSDKDNLRTGISEHNETHGKWDIIIHCAGATKSKDKDGFDKSNYQATRIMIECLQELNMMPRQFIYISTLSVYGPIHEENFEPIKESDIPHPNTAYAESKFKTEQYLKSIPGLPYVILRPTGVYGPREKDYYLMAKSIKNHVDFSVALKRQDLTFIYVKDLIQVIYLAIDKQVTQREYFVSDGEVYSSRTFSDYIKKELKKSFVLRIKLPLFILKVVSLLAEKSASGRNASTLNSDKYKIMVQKNWQCDIAPLLQELDYTPQYNLEKGVKETIAWYKKEGWL